ncbi:MAG TPA: hypothetical protein PLA80_13890, partial [Synergistaceae bacterium]|nr:hypothetical protein [Synergistaceae bacterium]
MPRFFLFLQRMLIMRSFYVVFSVLFESRLKVSHVYQFLGLLADWFARAGMDDLSHVREGLHPVSLGPLRFLDGREHDFLRREGERGDPFFPCVPGDLLAGRVAFLR